MSGSVGCRVIIMAIRSERVERDDRQLIADYRAGDEKAFERFYRRHHERLYLYCARMLGDRRQAEDLTQEVWLRMARLDGESRRDIDRPLPFLYRIARNLCLNAIRDRARTEPREEEEIERLRQRQQSSGDDRLEALAVALGSLPVEQREVIVLNAYVGYDFAEIAEMLGISRSAAWKRASRGREKIREILTGVER